MKDDKKVPQLRFPEFTDAWKQCKLSDLVNVIDGDRGKNYPTEADFEPHGHTLFLNASNVTIDGFLFDTNQFITEEKSNSMGSGKIIKDDIIITSRGSLGHIAWYNDSVQQVMPHLRINSGMLILRNKANVKTSYLHQFMKSDKGKAQIVFMSFGSAQPQLTKKGVESFTVNYPMDTEEQIKIGAFFSKLDNTITLQQRKLNSLQKLKKGLLQKMFPKNGENIPEIRFPEFSDAWKQRELGEIAERVTRRNSSLESQTPLTISAEYGLIDQNKFFGKRIAAKDLSNYYLIQKGEFAYNKSTSNDAPWGAIKRLDCYNNGALSTLYIVFKIKDNKSCYSDFLVTYYGTSLWHKGVKEIASEGARNHGLLNVSPSDFFRTKLVIPQDFEEQRKIGAFFTQLDNTITLQQRKLESLQKLKKGLLQQMFI